jgi:predicted transcriptional regulator
MYCVSVKFSGSVARRCKMLELRKMVPHEVAYEFQVLPVSFNPETNTLGLVGIEEANKYTIAMLSFLLGCNVVVIVYSEEPFWMVFEKAYPPRFEVPQMKGE